MKSTHISSFLRIRHICCSLGQVQNDYMMADVCIVCEAFLQACLENLLCDECRKPAQTLLEKKSAIDEGAQDISLLSSYKS